MAVPKAAMHEDGRPIACENNSHAEPGMDHRGAMLEVTAGADQCRLGVGAQLRRSGA
jgi:hypothetical protein